GHGAGAVQRLRQHVHLVRGALPLRGGAHRDARQRQRTGRGRRHLGPRHELRKRVDAERSHRLLGLPPRRTRRVPPVGLGALLFLLPVLGPGQPAALGRRWLCACTMKRRRLCPPARGPVAAAWPYWAAWWPALEPLGCASWSPPWRRWRAAG